MLEFSLPAGGLFGVVLSGALKALLEEEGISPDIVTAVSSGGHAAYLVYGGASREKTLDWFPFGRRHIRDNAFLESERIKRELKFITGNLFAKTELLPAA